MAIAKEDAVPVVWHKICSVLRQSLARQPVCVEAAKLKLRHHKALSLIRQIEMYEPADVELWLTGLIIDALQGCQILSIRAQAGGEQGLGKLHCPCQGPLWG